MPAFFNKGGRFFYGKANIYIINPLPCSAKTRILTAGGSVLSLVANGNFNVSQHLLPTGPVKRRLFEETFEAPAGL